MSKDRPSKPISRRSALAGFAAGGLGNVLAGTRHHAAGQEATPIAEANDVTVERDVAYGDADSESQVLDVFRPPDRVEPRPAVVLFHGGAWSYHYGGRIDMASPARAMADAGYVAFNIEYRRTGDPVADYVWPAQLDDVQRAVRWVRANAGTYCVDPDRIGAYGHSAGGHLASMLGVRETRDDTDVTLAGFSSRVSCVVALAGQFDLTIPYSDAFARDAVIALLGGTVEEVPNAYSDASPVTWTDADSASFLIIHGGADDQILPIQARTMVDALQDAAVDVVYAEFGLGDHFSVASWSNAGPWALTFFGEYLRPER